MSSTPSNIKLFTGTSHPNLALSICRRLGLPLSKSTILTLPSGELSITLHESVRNSDVYILNTSSSPTTSTNRSLFETLIMIHSAKIASAKRINVLLPLFPYARQDKKDKSRAPISAKLVANLLSGAGADHVITMDLHASQIQGFFDVPVDNLYAEPTITSHLLSSPSHSPSHHPSVIVSPDAGGAKRASSLASSLGLDFALFHKERKKVNEVSRMVLVGKVEGMKGVLVDDMADTCGTLISATTQLLASGAHSVIAIVTHGILSGDALKKIFESRLERLIVSNTIPQGEHKMGLEELKKKWIEENGESGEGESEEEKEIRRLKMLGGERLIELDISHVLAETVRRSHYGESISYLFDAIPSSEPVQLDYSSQQETLSSSFHSSTSASSKSNSNSNFLTTGTGTGTGTGIGDSAGAGVGVGGGPLSLSGMNDQPEGVVRVEGGL